MALIEALAPLTVGFVTMAVVYRLVRFAYLLVAKRRPPILANVLDPVPRRPFWSCFAEALISPWTRFTVHANPLWVGGLLMYHAGIVVMLTTYGVTLGLVLLDISAGNPLPDVSTGIAMSYNYSVTNIALLVFGGSEPEVASFLFGDFAKLFIVASGVDVACAGIGNLVILWVRYTGLAGAVVRNIDLPTRGLRVAGWRVPMHAIVSVVISGIIVTEILSRAHLTDQALLVHVLLGLVLVAIMPFTYLWHVFSVWVALLNSAARRQRGQLA